MRVLDGHLRSGDGDLLDLLAVDCRSGFVLIEIDRGDGEYFLSRILRHRQWVASQFLFLRKIYRAGPIIKKPPRVLILAERFETRLLEALNRQSPGIQALTYRILMSGERPHLYLEPAPELPSASPAFEEPPPQEMAPAEESSAEEQEPPVPQPDRLSEEEWEAFYEFERLRMAAERGQEQVKA